MDIAAKYGKSRVTQSPLIGQILEKYTLLGQSMSMNKFYATYVKKMDPGISHRQWSYFMQKYMQNVREKSATLIEKAEDSTVTDMQLEESSLHKILTISDTMLDELVAHPEILATIPVSKRLGWLFSAMSARDSRAKVAILQKDIQRKQNIYEDMVKGAQYGALDADELRTQRERRSTSLPDDPIEVELEIELKGEAVKEKTHSVIFDANDL
jgi:hypothetical protein